MTFSSIIFLALAAVTCCQVAQAQKCVIEGYFVVENNVLDRYLREVTGSTSPITRQATAKNNLRKDIDYILTAAKKLLGSLKSWGVDVELRVRDLVILDCNVIPTSNLVRGNKIRSDRALKAFDCWLKTQGSYAKLKYDFAILWTKYDLLGRHGSQSAGRAHIGTVCDSKLATGVVEFSATYPTAVTTAHEIGHILGATHDGPKSQYIMADGSRYGNIKRRWGFSKYSASSIEETLSALSTNCYLTTNSATKEIGDSFASYDGHMLDPNVACQRRMNDVRSYMCMSSSIYDGKPPAGDTVCQDIFCRTPDTSSCIAEFSPEWMVCGVNKRCVRGKCVATPTAPAPGLDDKCPLGDQKQVRFSGFNFTGTCQEFFKEHGVRGCYYIHTRCCATCGRHNTGRPGCMFGDLNKGCKDYTKESVCPRNRTVCCDYCKDYRGKRSAKEGYGFQVTLTEDAQYTKLFLEEDVKVYPFKRTIDVAED